MTAATQRDVRISSPLGRVVGETGADDRHLNDMAMAAWHKRGVVMIRPGDLRNDIDRLHVEQIAERLYGKRNQGQRG